MLPAGTFNMSYEQDMAIIRTRFQWGAFITFLIALFALPLYVPDYWLTIVNTIGYTLVAMLGLNILTGYCGQISIGQAAFVGVGAYTAAALGHHLGWSAWATLPVSALTAGFIGLIFGLPALRVKGFYLAMTTLGAQFMILYAFNHGGNLTGGITGLEVDRPAIGGFVFDSEQKFFYLIIIVSIIMVFLAKNLIRTRTGRAFVAVRDNDLAAEVLGINLAYYKLLAFFICCVFAGVAGWLKIYHIGSAFPDHYPLMDSIWWLGFLIVGGMGSITGAIFGAISYVMLLEWITVLSPMLGNLFPGVSHQLFAALGLVITGLVIAIFIVFEPRGIHHRWELFKLYYRLLPFSY